MWSWLGYAALAGDEAHPEETGEVAPAEDPRGYFAIGAGASVGRVDDEIAPVFHFGAEVGRELGARRGHLLLVDFGIDMASTSRALYHQRASIGWDARKSFGNVRLSAGPRLWMASLADTEGTIALSPGLSLGSSASVGIGKDWSLAASMEGGRGFGPAWPTIGALPLTHANLWLGVVSPVGLGLGIGAQQVGSLQTGLLSLGLGL